METTAAADESHAERLQRLLADVRAMDAAAEGAQSVSLQQRPAPRRKLEDWGVTEPPPVRAAAARREARRRERAAHAPRPRARPRPQSQHEADVRLMEAAMGLAAADEEEEGDEGGATPDPITREILAEQRRERTQRRRRQRQREERARAEAERRRRHTMHLSASRPLEPATAVAAAPVAASPEPPAPLPFPVPSPPPARPARSPRPETQMPALQRRLRAAFDPGNQPYSPRAAQQQLHGVEAAEHLAAIERSLERAMAAPVPAREDEGQARLQVASDAFEDLIDCMGDVGPLLRDIKDEYDRLLLSSSSPVGSPSRSPSPAPAPSDVVASPRVLPPPAVLGDEGSGGDPSSSSSSEGEGEGDGDDDDTRSTRSARRPKGVPPTKIPPEDHIVERRMFPPTGGKTDSAYSVKEGLWLHTVFPSAYPDHSDQQRLLEEWFERQLPDLDRMVAEAPTPEVVDKVLPVANLCFHELLRQVATTSEPRAEVMADVWGMFNSLLDEVHRVTRADVVVGEQQRDALSEDNAALRAKIEAEEARLADLVATQEKLSDRCERLQTDVDDKVGALKAQRRLAETIRSKASNLIRDLEAATSGRGGGGGGARRAFQTNPGQLFEDLDELLQQRGTVRLAVKPSGRRMSLLGLLPQYDGGQAAARAEDDDDDGDDDEEGGETDGDTGTADDEPTTDDDRSQEVFQGVESLLKHLDAAEFQGTLTELARVLATNGVDSLAPDDLEHLAVVESDLRAVKLQLERLCRVRPRMRDSGLQCDGVRHAPALSSATEATVAVSTAKAVREVPLPEPEPDDRGDADKDKDEPKPEGAVHVPSLPADVAACLDSLRHNYIPNLLAPLELHRKIHDAYRAKIDADRLRDAEQARRQPLPAALFDFCVANAHSVAEARETYCDLVVSAQRRRDESNAIKTFARFLGFGSPLAADALDLHLDVLRALAELPSAHTQFESSDGLHWVNMEAVEAGVVGVLQRRMAAKAVEDLVAVLRDSCNRQTGGSIICVSDMSALVLTAWAAERERNMGALRNVFRGGDTNNDGELSFDEFAAIVRRVDRGRSTPEVSQMYREALHHTEVNNADAAEAFVRVAQAHRLVVWDLSSAWHRRHGDAAAADDQLVAEAAAEASKAAMMEKLRARWRRRQREVADLVERAETELDPAVAAEHADRYAHFLTLLDQTEPGPASEALELMIVELRGAFPGLLGEADDVDTDSSASEGESGGDGSESSAGEDEGLESEDLF